ncbi:MAG: RHS repeat-associated core domain-containing protein, partial [Candidatus Eremiobacteraeota bacterium]|nr:RHS repeat-associated core domain-containing protein [Candidatus Eremiobacteraeota bacterium]
WSGWTQAGGAQLTVNAPAQSWSWIGDPSGNDAGVFPFGQTPNPALWRLRSTVTVVRDDGLPAESVDASGMTHATLYDVVGQVQCAIASNASFAGAEAAFTSFEAYEDASSWAFTGGAAPYAGDGHGGSQSLALPTNATATVVLTPDPTRILFLGAWCKTPVDWTPSAAASWTLTVAAGSVTLGEPVVLPFAATGGVWGYQSVPVDLPALVPNGTRNVTVTIAAANGAASTVLVDDVAAFPLASKFAAHTYDPVYRLMLARTDGTGKTWFTLRDASLRRVGGTNPDGTPAALQLAYLSLAGNPGGFAAGDPNASLAIRALGPGTCETFRDGDDWTAGWTPSDATAFVASNGVLAHASTTSSATLTSVAAPASGAMAFYCELVSLDGTPLVPTDDIAVAVGDATFTLAVATGQWSATVDGTTLTPLATFVGPPRWLLLLQVGGYLTLHANGQLLFSTAARASGAASLTTGANALGIANLTLFDAPAVMAKYSDATGASRQTQALTAESYTVTQAIRDACGKTVVRTKPAPGAFGGGAALPVPAYRSTFVANVPAFVAGLAGAATMQGDVADWYDGTNDTDDQGYPYQRVVPEPGRTARPLEIGFAGLASAIVDYGSTSPAARATVQFAYGANASDTVPSLDLPAGAFGISMHSSPAKVVQTSVADAMNRVVAQFSALGDESVLSATMPAFGNGSATVTTEEPDAFAFDDDAFVSAQTSNALGQVGSDTSPDAGLLSFAYDVGGRVRFTQDAAAAAGGYATYFTWDGLGRRRSRGTVACTTFADLQAYADDPLWPEDQTTVAFTQQKSYVWDGDGTDPDAIGLLVQQSATTGTTPTTVTQTFAWDGRGRPASQTTTIATNASTLGTFTTTYTYDVANRMTSITYPNVAGVGFTSAVYAYDGHDRVVAITDQAGMPFATYTYNPLGKVIAAAYGANAIPAARTYDSAGRLLTSTVGTNGTSYGATLTYTPDSVVETLSESLSSNTASYAADVTYAYDELGRLTGAVDAQSARTLALSFVQPDGAVEQNGNLQSITNGAGTTTTLLYGSGSNQAVSVQYGDAAALAYGYDANGNVAGVGASAFGYLPGSTLPQSVTDGATSVALAYDASGSRVLKQVDGGTPELRMYGGASGPLVTVDATGTATAWVYAPSGPIAMATNGARYVVVTDYLVSPRAVMDDDANVVAAYAHDVLGNVVSSVEPASGFVPFQFTGYELDLETGLYAAGARMYDPTTSRFLAPDPAGQYASGYAYAGNMPTMLVDPTGQMTKFGEIAIEVVSAVAILGSMVLTGGATSELLVADLAFDAATLASFGTVAFAGAVGGAISSGAVEAITYSAETPPGLWNTGQFFESVGVAMAAGAVGGAFSGVATPLANAGWDAVEDALFATATDEIAPATSAAAPAPPSDPLADGVPERSPAPDPARSDADDAPRARRKIRPLRSDWVELAKNVVLSAGTGAAGNVVEALVQDPLQNLVEGKPARAGLGWSVLESAGKGFVLGGLGGAASTFFEYNTFGITKSTIKSWWTDDRIAFVGCIAVGGAVALGTTGAGFYALNTVVQHYTSNGGSS